VDISRAAAVIRAAQHIVALTGAGISAESGIPTFRGPDGYWRQYKARELATPEAFASDPTLVWTWYDERRQTIAAKAPNAGHRVLAKWATRPAGLTIVTQNVDGLHQRAGSRQVLCLHGNIWQTRCTRDGRIEENLAVPLAPLPPTCAHCGALLRPHIVWFGENLPGEASAAAADHAAHCDVMLVIGTSGSVYPAAALPETARAAGATIIEINTTATALSDLAHIVLTGPAAHILTEIDHAL
jgi:NAD-dependent deacetylase